MFFIQMGGFDEKCNIAVNEAIKYSDDENCENINTAHMFIALVHNTASGKMILNHLDMDFDGLYDAYKTLVNNGDFGHSDKSFMAQILNARLDSFSSSMGKLISKLTAVAFTERELITPDKFMQAILEEQEDIFMHLLAYIEIEPEEIDDIINSYFVIPEALEAFVKDMTSSEVIKNSTYVSTEKYTDEIVEILGRKKKPNPILVGKAGVGKTAVVEAFAQRVMNEDVPNFLIGSHICSVEGSVLTAGTRYRGDFEARIKQLLDFAENTGAILFFDEIHSFVNAGSGVQGAETAGNMLKTKMNEGTIRVIGATTHKEYKKFIENDDAFCRRMENIEVKEPSMEDAETIVIGSMQDYISFHKVNITEDNVRLASRYSERYMKSKCFPDKIYTVLDHACSKVKVAGKTELSDADIQKTVSKLTGINVEQLQDGHEKKLLSLEETVKQRVVGQDNAVKTVCKAIRRGKCGINDPRRPIASFLFVGPTGVGKTELCKVLSKEVALGDAAFIKIDMSEYADKISVNKFIGSAPGYVGYGEGGQLTEKVKHNPYSLVLFDEIEKAHPDVFNIFLQILDEGRLTDSDGQTVDFTNCIIAMTSNAGYGAEGFSKGKLGFGVDNSTMTANEKERKAMEALESTFKPEFLNRIDNIVIFEKLENEQCEKITTLLLDELKQRVFKEKNIDVEFNSDVVALITKQGYSDKYGARNIRREIQNTVEDAIAVALLSGRFNSGDSVIVELDENSEIKIEERVENNG